MKKIIILAVGFFFLASGVSSAGFFGPAKSQVAPGQLSFGVGLATNDAEWDFGLDNAGSAVFDVNQQQFYLQATYGLTGTTELYTHLGLTTLEISDLLALNEFRDSGPFATIGIKEQVYRGKSLSVGVFVEGSYFSSYEDAAATAKVEIDESYAVVGGIVFQKEVDNAVIYGGPFFYIRAGDFEFTTPSSGASGTFESDSNLGGFVGYRLFATTDLVFDLEVQFRDKASVAGGFSLLF